MGTPRPGAAGRRRTAVRRDHGRTAAVVALGGAAGAAARYGATLLWPTGPAAFPWTTLGVNSVGCAAIGVFLGMPALRSGAAREPRPLLRPFFATGVLGGFTTFSAYTVESALLLERGRTVPGLTALLLTPATALTAVRAGSAVTAWCAARSSARSAAHSPALSSTRSSARLAARDGSPAAGTES